MMTVLKLMTQCNSI